MYLYIYLSVCLSVYLPISISISMKLKGLVWQKEGIICNSILSTHIYIYIYINEFRIEMALILLTN